MTDMTASDRLCLPRVYVAVGLLSVVRAFAAPGWNNIADTPITRDFRDKNSPLPPALSPEAVENLVMSIFYLIEGRLSPSFHSGPVRDEHCRLQIDQSIGIESVLYLSALTTLALEIHCVTLRRRIMYLFDAIEARGFAAAGLALDDIKLAWAMTEPRCGALCQCTQS